MRIQSLMVHSLGALALTAVSLSAVGAQTASVDPRLQPWVGCWRTVYMPPTPGQADIRPTAACVIPSTSIAGSVDIALYAGDSVLSRATVPAVGAATPRTVGECTGTESAEWTAGDLRLIMRADLACDRGVKRVETGVMSMAPNGDWVQLQNLEVGKNAATTVVRFRFDAPLTAKQTALRGVTASNEALMRLAMGSTVTPDQVLDLAKRVPVGLAQTWVAEMGQSFDLNGKALVRLADRGMPAPVLDVMVALSNPKAFVVGAGRPEQAMGDAQAVAAIGANLQTLAGNRTMRSRCSTLDDFCYGPGGMGAWGFGWQYGYGMDPWGYPMMSRYGFSPFSYGNPYGYGFGNGLYFGQQPIIIVTRPSGSGDENGNGAAYRPIERGRAVSGGGYTRTGTSGGSSASPSSGGSSGGVSGAASPASSVGGGGGGGGEVRTAKPRGGGL